MQTRFGNFLLALALTLVSLVASAQRQPVYLAEPISGDSIYVGKTVSVMDTAFYNATIRPTIARTYALRNIISLRINEDSRKVMPDSFSLSVDVRVYYADTLGNADSILNRTLTINYNKNRDYDNRAVFYFSNASYVAFKVTGINVTHATSSQVLPLVLMDNRLVVDRDYTVDCSLNAVSLFALQNTISTNGELRIQWTPNLVSQAYDLEWAWIDGSALDSGAYNDTNGRLDLRRVFRNNATRITTKAASYNVPMLYDGDGKLFFRVRGVNTTPAGEIVPTRWSSEIDTVYAHWSFAYTGHERNLNWQASTTFAEEGKRKSVVQYFDGSLRARQVVTKDNTSGQTIVAETLYDFQGRPAIQVMPAPTLEKLIKYNPYFNTRGINGAEYDAAVFDKSIDSTEYCGVGAEAMSTASGAARYYSAENTEANTGFHKYIPDARGFAFTETQYTADGSGRISRQGGVDQTFQLGSGHETKYFYGKPAQDELDALFGTEVGEASHYQKNMVRDPNGQYSVSYVDMRGRTIATALAGPVPANVDSLSSYRPDSLQALQVLNVTNNIIDGERVIYSQALFMTRSDSVRISYSLGKDSLTLADCKAKNICYDCLYDLDITITGDCSNTVDGGNTKTIKMSSVSLFRVDTACSLARPIDTSFSVYLAEGSYTITKVLSLSSNGRDFLRDSVFMIRNLCRTYDSIYREQLDLIRDSLNCNGDTTSEPYHRQYRDQMLADLLPLTGQYGDSSSSHNCFSIFDKTGGRFNYQAVADTGYYRNEAGGRDSVVNSLGDEVAPQDLKPDEFISNFKESWLPTLLSLHPEYCLLTQWERLSASHEWDEAFEQTETFSEAVLRGYLNPTGMTTAPGNLFPAGNDPLYSYSFITDAKSQLEDSLRRYIRYSNYAGHHLSLWGFATAMGKCGAVTDTVCLKQWNAVGNIFDSTALCRGELDMAWRTFRNLYLAEKREWLDAWMRARCSTSIAPLAPCQPLFPRRDAILQGAGYGGADPYVDGAIGQAIADSSYAANCEGYRAQWKEQIGNCYADTNVRNAILDRLVLVCREGSDITHPFGASTVRPASTYNFRSFAEVFTWANATYGAPADPSTCTVDRIDAPQPYETPFFTVSSEVWSKPDSCVCTRITNLQAQYIAAPSGYTNFSAYLAAKQKVNLSQAQLDSLLGLCSGTISCKYLATPISLPPALQCGAASCLDCGTMTALVADFRKRYPGLEPRINAQDSAQLFVNGLFANYLNVRTRTQHSATDYLIFMQQCGIGASSTADSLLLLVQNFRNQYTSNPNQYFGQWSLTPASYAIISAADALANARSNPSGSALPIGYAIYPWSYNFMLPLRGIAPYDGNDTVFNVNVPVPRRYTYPERNLPEFDNQDVRPEDFAGGPVWFQDLANIYFSPNLSDIDDGFRLIWTSEEGGVFPYFKISPPNRKFLYDVTSGHVENHIFRLGFFRFDQPFQNPSQYENWLNGLNFNNCVKTSSIKGVKNLRFDPVVLPPASMYNFNYSTSGLMATVVYRDNTEADVYVVANHGGGQIVWKEYSDTSTGASECHLAFTTYFNQQTRSRLSQWQIDSLYRSHGLYPEFCSSVRDTLSLLCPSQPFDTLVPIQLSSCADTAQQAALLAGYLYEQYRDSLRSRFDELHTNRCLAVVEREQLTITRPVSEYHYTLYYYDQAGNLVKTVPPHGVKPRRDGAFLAAVADARMAGTEQTTEHTLTTRYRYNSLNQVVSQFSPDGRHSRFWYDRLGRLVVSQNRQQEVDDHWSYTKYDAIGRIVEVGQKKQVQGMTQAVSRSATALQKWLEFRNFDAAYQPRMVTATGYDLVSGYAHVYESFTPFRQKAHTLRNRVSFVRNFDRLEQTIFVTGADTSYAPNYLYHNTSVEYSYDIHGNVDSMLNIAAAGTLLEGYGHNAFKLISYKYDLISGKVNEVHYQPGFVDEFYHRYVYDADNKLIDVYTSDNKAFLGQTGLEEHDAHYEYYRHGPLARTVLGQQQVQGVDYAYTLQGWLKGINSTNLNAKDDIGQDGYPIMGSSAARDVYSYALNYFGGAYVPIHQYAEAAGMAPVTTGSERQLYNGNISSMAVNIGVFNQPQLYRYSYDQLNRITSMDVFRGSTPQQPGWGTLTATTDYQERVSYDGAGNILKYRRNAGGSPLLMDSLSYHYYPGMNRLNHVRDMVWINDFAVDIDDQPVDNYRYDSIGNLKSSNLEGIHNIDWNVYGKILGIYRGAGAGQASSINYRYDPSGNRVSKALYFNGGSPRYNWYVRDAQSNVMAVYEMKANENWSAGPLKLIEHHLYGSSRLGLIQRDQNVFQGRGDSAFASLIGKTYWTTTDRGMKVYELSNHLGNVLVAITDKKQGVDDGEYAIAQGGCIQIGNYINCTPSSPQLVGGPDGKYDYYTADVVNANDYYPFGMLMPGRRYAAGNLYRYGFNGKENDNEVDGEGGQIDFIGRIYDPRVGKWLSLDPLMKKYPGESNYAFTANNPVFYGDGDGKDKIVTVTVIGNDGETIIMRSIEPGKFDYHNDHGWGNEYYYKANIHVNVTIDMRSRKGSISSNVDYSTRKQISWWRWSKFSSVTDFLFSSGGENQKTRYGYMITANGKSTGWQDGLPRAANGSKSLNLSEWLGLVGGLREAASPTEILDFNQNKVGQAVYDRIFKVLEAIDKSVDAGKALAGTDNSSPANYTESARSNSGTANSATKGGKSIEPIPIGTTLYPGSPGKDGSVREWTDSKSASDTLWAKYYRTHPESKLKRPAPKKKS